MLKKGMILSVVAGIALVSWCAFNAANANVCFLPDGDCSTDNTSSLADGDNPWRNGDPNNPNNDCSGFTDPLKDANCWDCTPCTSNGVTKYKCWASIKNGYVLERGRCVKVNVCLQYNLTEKKDANCYDCEACPSDGTKYKCWNNIKDGYELIDGKCKAECPTGFKRGITCDSKKEATLNDNNDSSCVKCVNDECPNGAKSLSCDSGFEKKPNGKYSSYSHSPCYTCEKNDECTYQYRHATSSALQPTDSQGNTTNGPDAGIIGKTLYDYYLLYDLHKHKDVYVNGATPIYGIFNRVDRTSNSCTRKVGNINVKSYEKICAGVPKSVCTKKGSNYKFVSNGCSSEEYGIYSSVTANGDEWGDCVKNCKNGKYNTKEECEKNITNSNNQKCELEGGCYSVVTTKATVKYVNAGVANGVVNGTYGGIDIGINCSSNSVQSGGGLSCSVVNFATKIKNGALDWNGITFLSRNGVQVEPGEYAVCYEAWSNSGATVNGQYQYAHGLINLKIDYAIISENSDLSNAQCYVDRTLRYNEHHGKKCNALEERNLHSEGLGWEIRCFKYNLEKGKTYYVGTWISTGGGVCSVGNVSPIDGTPLGF